MIGDAINPIALTMGEPAGIGPELTLQAWNAHLDNRAPSFFVIGDPRLYTSLGASVASISSPAEARSTGTALPVLAEELDRVPDAGHPSNTNAPAVISAIKRAVGLVQSRQASAIVTNPISKSALYEAGFRFQGHTDYLGALACDFYPNTSSHAVMMLMAKDLKVVLVTEHLSLAAVAAAISTDVIVQRALITINALKADFGIEKPRLAIAALNPHAGEGGAMGKEEATIIAPAIARLKDEGLLVSGPLPADTLFHEEARKKFDAVLCMYHDQGLIPVKMLDFWGGVNVTLGLPFVRTSPDHGVAFDIAGQGVARPDSLLAALSVADQISQRRNPI